MPRSDVVLSLTSIGYSDQSIGQEFSFKIVPTPGGKPVEFGKRLVNGKTAKFKRPLVILDRVVDTAAIALAVEAMEGREKEGESGSGKGSVDLAKKSGFVDVYVVGKGARDEGKKARLQLGFNAVVSDGPERIARLCAELRAVVARFGLGAQPDALRLALLRIAWHESGGLTTTVQQNSGPARGLYQMQRPAAISALDAMRPDLAYNEFAAAGGFRAAINLDFAIDDLRKVKGPGFGGNPVGDALAKSPRCATLAAIWYLRNALDRLPAPGDLPAAAEFWEDEWHRVQSAGKKEEFMRNVEYLEKLRAQLPERECGLLP